MQEVDVNDQVQSTGAAAREITSAPAPTMTWCSYGNKLTREELAQVKTPAGTAIHKPIPHITVVEKLIEAPQLSPNWRSAGRECGLIRWHADVRSDGPKLRF